MNSHTMLHATLERSDDSHPSASGLEKKSEQEERERVDAARKTTHSAKYANAMKYLVYNYGPGDAAESKALLTSFTATSSRSKRNDRCQGEGVTSRPSASLNLAFPTCSNEHFLTREERERARAIVHKELKQTTLANEILSKLPGVGFKTVPSMNVTEMRRCLKHGRQRLQCNRPHAPIALCERILGDVTLGEFGHWLQLMYHLRRFVKGLVKSCNLTPAMQQEIVFIAQHQIILDFEEPPEAALWCMEYAHAHYTTDCCAPDEYCSVVRPRSSVCDVASSDLANEGQHEEVVGQPDESDAAASHVRNAGERADCRRPEQQQNRDVKISGAAHCRVVPLRITMTSGNATMNSNVHEKLCKRRHEVRDHLLKDSDDGVATGSKRRRLR